jgi:hypothetical protein
MVSTGYFVFITYWRLFYPLCTSRGLFSTYAYLVGEGELFQGRYGDTKNSCTYLSLEEGWRSECRCVSNKIAVLKLSESLTDTYES